MAIKTADALKTKCPLYKGTKAYLFHGDLFFMAWLTNLNYLLKTVKKKIDTLYPPRCLVGKYLIQGLILANAKSGLPFILLFVLSGKFEIG